MLRLAHSITIDRPRGAVFAFVTNTENVTRWKQGLTEARRRTSGPVGVGTVETHVSRFLGRRFEVDHEITAYVPGRAVHFRTTSGPFPSAGRFAFDDADGGTRLTILSEAEPPLAFWPLVPIIGLVGIRRLRRDLRALKQAIEKGGRGRSGSTLE